MTRPRPHVRLLLVLLLACIPARCGSPPPGAVDAPGASTPWVGQLPDDALEQGCACTLVRAGGPDDGAPVASGPVDEAELRLLLDGQVVTLLAVDAPDPGSSFAGEGYRATIVRLTEVPCTPGDETCEGISFSATLRVERGPDRVQVEEVRGACGC